MVSYRQPDDSPTKVTASRILAYVWAVAALGLGLWTLNGNATAAVLFLLSAYAVAPNTRRWYEGKLNVRLSRGAVAAVGLVFYGLGALVYSFA